MSTVDEVKEGLSVGAACAKALHRIMSETQDVAANHHNKHKARIARKLLSRHQNQLQRLGLVWVAGQGIKVHGK